MNRIIAGCCVALVPLAVSVFGQDSTPVLTPGHGAGAPPAYAFDIPKADIDLLLKDHPGGDKDMGKYNMGIGVIYRGPTNDKPGDRIVVPCTMTTPPKRISSPPARASLQLGRHRE